MPSDRLTCPNGLSRSVFPPQTTEASDMPDTEKISKTDFAERLQNVSERIEFALTLIDSGRIQQAKRHLENTNIDIGLSLDSLK
jgi:hypothetical protein